MAKKVQDVCEHAMLFATHVDHVLLAPLVLIASPSNMTTEVEAMLNCSSGQKLQAVLHSANASELCGQRGILAEQRALQIPHAQVGDQYGNYMEGPLGGLTQGWPAFRKHGL